MAKTLFLAFWNLENLFDLETAARSDKLRKLVGNDLVGWNGELLGAKLKQLSKVIRSLNGGTGPDILGVCEVESQGVLQKLVDQIGADGGRRYAIAHADTSDNRGIDVAFLYDAAIAAVPPGAIFQHWVVKRYATREIFQVNFRVDGKLLAVIGNHWPSRSAGQYESEPYRMTAGETLAYWVERIQEEHGKETAIVVMGDFNDEPFNRSLCEYALSVNDRQRVINGSNPYLLNLMWPLLSAGRGSHMFEGQWNLLDQILISRGIVNGKSGWHLAGEAQIEAVALMKYPRKLGPRRFGLSPGERDLEGFSDHYPVSVVLGVEVARAPAPGGRRG
jgi:predicted extracellular nuclease